MVNSLSRSPLIRFLTGIPVAFATTLAMSSLVTLDETKNVPSAPSSPAAAASLPSASLSSWADSSSLISLASDGITPNDSSDAR